MNSIKNGKQADSSMTSRRAAVGSKLIKVSAFVMIAGSIVKALHPAKVVAYMGSMGYQGGTFYLIAVLELLCAIVFLLPVTRSLGLLLVSAYFGGAISAHLAHHPPVIGGPFLMYMSIHPYAGSLVPSMVLACASVGVWLRHPEMVPIQNPYTEKGEPSRQQQGAAAVLARS